MRSPAATLIAPVAQGPVAGTTGIVPFFAGPARFQQAFDASAFLSAMPDGGTITRMSFSSTGYAAFILTEIANAQVNLSTTTASPTNLSAVFSQNIGTDEAVVFGPGALVLNNGSGGQWAAHIDINPFFYDPRQGNLLLDVRNFSGSVNWPNSSPYFDGIVGAQLLVGVVNGSSADAQSGGVGRTYGILTQFTFTPIPEPSVLWIVISAAASAVGCKKICRK